jgi:long-chain acyl-CoA synthetase
MPLSELPAFFRRIAQYQREFLVFDNGWRGWTYSYSDIAQMAGQVAVRLRAGEIRKGDRVIIWSESRPGWVAALWACLMEGIILVPVEAFASLELFRRIEQQVQPHLILVGDLVSPLEEPKSIPVWRLIDIETVTGGERAGDSGAVNQEDIAEIIFTSGTTSAPKGVVMTHGNLAAGLKPLEDQLVPYRRYFRLLAPLRALNLLPMSHLFGQSLTLFVAPVIPASIVFLTTTSPEEVVRQIRPGASAP